MTHGLRLKLTSLHIGRHGYLVGYLSNQMLVTVVLVELGMILQLIWATKQSLIIFILQLTKKIMPYQWLVELKMNTNGLQCVMLQLFEKLLMVTGIMFSRLLLPL